jgi:hypothetical protein
MKRKKKLLHALAKGHDDRLGIAGHRDEPRLHLKGLDHRRGVRGARPGNLLRVGRAGGIYKVERKKKKKKKKDFNLVSALSPILFNPLL